MPPIHKYGLVRLAEKVLVVASTSLGMLNTNNAIALPTASGEDSNGKITFENYASQKAKPNLVLKLNSNAKNRLLADHSSHSSHSSHRSHASHYSGSSGGGDGGSDGIGAGGLVVGGLIAYGAYQLGKRNKNKTD